MKFKDQPTPNFNFKAYIQVKYAGFFPESLPTWEEIQAKKMEAKRALDPEANKLYSEYRGMLSRYNKVMREWARLQK